MWQKYKLSKHKHKPHHLPLLAFEEREFEKKRYLKIRCRHYNRVISEWISKQTLEKISPQVCNALIQQQGCKISRPDYYILDLFIKKDYILYKIMEEGKIVVRVLAEDLLDNKKESYLVSFLEKELLSAK